MRHKFYIILLPLVFLLWNCGTENITGVPVNEYLAGLKTDTSVKYAKRFSIAENRYCKVVYLFGNLNIKDTSAKFIIIKDSAVKIDPGKNTYVLKGACKKIASLSSVYSSMLCELGAAGQIAAIESIDYYNNASIIAKYNKGELRELCKNPELDVEQSILLNPDIIFTFGMGNPDKAPDRKIIMAGIPMVVTVDHLEETPLARAEWVKFFAAFVNKAEKADSVFKQVERRYNELKTIALTASSKPLVFTEVKHGEIWYVPGGKSFAATFISHANADYVWKDNAKTGSLHLGFEEVFIKAGAADFWLNQSLVKSKEELLALESRYGEFKAFKTGNLFNNIKNTNAKGYSDYWETGIMFPDRVLSDLILIFHPELALRIKNDLYYYKKLE